MLAVRWYLRYSLSYRDVEELLAERGIAAPELIDAAPAEPARRRGSLVRRRDLPEGRRTVGVSVPRDRPARAGHRCPGLAEAELAATRRFFARALNAARRTTEVTTDRAPAYPRVLDELVPEACHVV